jgi:hypothetical protein
MFSAKGAPVISSLEQRPQDSLNPKVASAESAIHSRGRFDHHVILTSVVSGFENQSRYESRFQRFLLCDLNSWGDAPGYDDVVQLAKQKRKAEDE